MRSPIYHHFIAEAVYLREMNVPDGYHVKKHKHAFDHVSLLTKGCVIVEKEGKQETYYAPSYIFIEQGIEHEITAVNGPVQWFCVNITTCMDVDNIDEVLIGKN